MEMRDVWEGERERRAESFYAASHFEARLWNCGWIQNSVRPVEPNVVIESAGPDILIAQRMLLEASQALRLDKYRGSRRLVNNRLKSRQCQLKRLPGTFVKTA